MKIENPKRSYYVVLSELPSDVVLPTELFLDVLIRLPLRQHFRNSYKEKLKYLIRLRCVSKFFIDLTNNPSFIHCCGLDAVIHVDKFNFLDTITTTSLYSSYPTSPPPGTASNWQCCQWRFHISFKGSNFIYLKKRHELIPFHCPNHMRLIGSMNGLVCFGGPYSFEIYNIFAGTNYYLIPSKCAPPDPNPIFGYEPMSNDYKILRIEDATIYSFRRNSWKHADGLVSCSFGLWPRVRYGTSLEGRSVCINGIIYWPPGKRTVLFHPYYIWTRIVSFDLRKEKFREIEIPEEDVLLPTQYPDIQLLSFRGCLAFAFIKRTKPRKGRRRGRGGEGKKTSSTDGGEIWVELFILKKSNGGGVNEQSEENYSWIRESIGVPVLSVHQKEAEIVSCCDEICLGWFESKQLRLYNLHTKSIFNLPLSPPSHYYPKVSAGKKMNDPNYVENLRFDFSLF